LEHISRISNAIPDCTSLAEFEKAILEHEDIVAKCLNMPKVKDLYFSDYWGCVKSLGAWGGDFILATSEASEEDTRKYFTQKGYTTVFKLAEMIRSESQVEVEV
jgi:hypothetical protein